LVRLGSVVVNLLSDTVQTLLQKGHGIKKAALEAQNRTTQIQSKPHLTTTS